MAGPKSKPTKMLVPRHSRIVRITHWLNALALFCLLFSGLQIFNAHPKLYWGQQSDFPHPWFAIGAYAAGGALHGVTLIAGHTFDTTGVLGASQEHGVWAG